MHQNQTLQISSIQNTTLNNPENMSDQNFKGTPGGHQQVARKEHHQRCGLRQWI